MATLTIDVSATTLEQARVTATQEVKAFLPEGCRFEHALEVTDAQPEVQTVNNAVLAWKVSYSVDLDRITLGDA